MSGLLQKYAGIQVYDDAARMTKLLALLEGMTESERALHYGGSPIVGNCYIKDSPGVEQCVLEVVFGTDSRNTIATLYKSDSLFQSLDSYRKGRAELIECVADLANTTPDKLGVNCPVRGRSVGLRELGLHQIIEIMQSAADTWTTDTSKTQH